MREIQGTPTPELSKHIQKTPVDAAPPFRVNLYTELVEHVAKLSYLNKDFLLFFRGQSSDYKSKSGSSTFYPSIYRGDYVTQAELTFRFDTLNEAARQLKALFARDMIDGHRELGRKKYIQWSILQHYGVCSTPLLDFTHSLRVACSFAQHKARSRASYVFVFGLPYVTNRITINSEHDIAIIRLLSISPPDALRPYFQEGYLAGTEDITNEYDKKTELDFKNRLIAKSEIPNNKSFWGSGFSAIPVSLLYPDGDRVEQLCTYIRTTVTEEVLPGQLGDFIKLWTDFEQEILSMARDLDPEVHTPRGAFNVLLEQGRLKPAEALTYNEIRSFRNLVAHQPRKVTQQELLDYMNRLSLFLKEIRNRSS